MCAEISFWISSLQQNVEPLTNRIDPDAKLGGAEGYCQSLCVGVNARWVLVDSSCKEGCCCLVTIQHRGQQRRSFLLCAAHRDCHTLSWVTESARLHLMTLQQIDHVYTVICLYLGPNRLGWMGLTSVRSLGQTMWRCTDYYYIIRHFSGHNSTDNGSSHYSNNCSLFIRLLRAVRCCTPSIITNTK